MTKIAYIGLIILAALVGLFIGYCIWIPDWHIPYLLKYDILRDTLTIVLTVSAVVITAIGVAIYLILSERLKRESASASRLESVQKAVQMFIHAGFVFWESYDRAVKKEPQYIEIAIGLTERAFLFYNQIPGKESRSRENERSLCLIKNNLAYYFALRKKVKDRDIAREYAEYVRGQASQYTEDKDNWLETYDFVKRQYPD